MSGHELIAPPIVENYLRSNPRDPCALERSERRKTNGSTEMEMLLQRQLAVTQTVSTVSTSSRETNANEPREKTYLRTNMTLALVVCRAPRRTISDRVECGRE